jgi:hypothetical protein
MSITIDDLVTVYSGDVVVHRKALDVTPERLFESVRLAFSHMGDDFFRSLSSLGSGTITLEEYLLLKREHEIAEAGRIAKGKHTGVRRADFNAKRSQLFLKMLEAGVVSRCAFPGCEEIKNLTVDHIVPLSRGGDDSLANLQFLCRSHNSAKGDGLDHKPEQR